MPSSLSHVDASSTDEPPPLRPASQGAVSSKNVAVPSGVASLEKPRAGTASGTRTSPLKSNLQQQHDQQQQQPAPTSARPTPSGVRLVLAPTNALTTPTIVTAAGEHRSSSGSTPNVQSEAPLRDLLSPDTLVLSSSTTSADDLATTDALRAQQEEGEVRRRSIIPTPDGELALFTPQPLADKKESTDRRHSAEQCSGDARRRLSNTKKPGEKPLMLQRRSETTPAFSEAVAANTRDDGLPWRAPMSDANPLTDWHEDGDPLAAGGAQPRHQRPVASSTASSSSANSDFLSGNWTGESGGATRGTGANPRPTQQRLSCFGVPGTNDSYGVDDDDEEQDTTLLDGQDSTDRRLADTSSSLGASEYRTLLSTTALPGAATGLASVQTLPSHRHQSQLAAQLLSANGSGVARSNRPLADSTHSSAIGFNDYAADRDDLGSPLLAHDDIYRREGNQHGGVRPQHQQHPPQRHHALPRHHQPSFLSGSSRDSSNNGLRSTAVFESSNSPLRAALGTVQDASLNRANQEANPLHSGGERSRSSSGSVLHDTDTIPSEASTIHGAAAAAGQPTTPPHALSRHSFDGTDATSKTRDSMTASAITRDGLSTSTTTPGTADGTLHAIGIRALPVSVLPGVVDGGGSATNGHFPPRMRTNSHSSSTASNSTGPGHSTATSGPGHSSSAHPPPPHPHVQSLPTPPPPSCASAAAPTTPLTRTTRSPRNANFAAAAAVGTQCSDHALPTPKSPTTANARPHGSSPRAGNKQRADEAREGAARASAAATKEERAGPSQLAQRGSPTTATENATITTNSSHIPAAGSLSGTKEGRPPLYGGADGADQSPQQHNDSRQPMQTSAPTPLAASLSKVKEASVDAAMDIHDGRRKASGSSISKEDESSSRSSSTSSSSDTTSNNGQDRTKSHDPLADSQSNFSLCSDPDGDNSCFSVSALNAAPRLYTQIYSKPSSPEPEGASPASSTGLPHGKACNSPRAKAVTTATTTTTTTLVTVPSPPRKEAGSPIQSHPSKASVASNRDRDPDSSNSACGGGGSSHYPPALTSTETVPRSRLRRFSLQLSGGSAKHSASSQHSTGLQVGDSISGEPSGNSSVNDCGPYNAPAHPQSPFKTQPLRGAPVVLSSRESSPNYSATPRTPALAHRARKLSEVSASDIPSSVLSRANAVPSAAAATPATPPLAPVTAAPGAPAVFTATVSSSDVGMSDRQRKQKSPSFFPLLFRNSSHDNDTSGVRGKGLWARKQDKSSTPSSNSLSPRNSASSKPLPVFSSVVSVATAPSALSSASPSQTPAATTHLVAAAAPPSLGTHDHGERAHVPVGEGSASRNTATTAVDECASNAARSVQSQTAPLHTCPPTPLGTEKLSKSGEKIEGTAATVKSHRSSEAVDEDINTSQTMSAAIETTPRLNADNLGLAAPLPPDEQRKEVNEKLWKDTTDFFSTPDPNSESARVTASLGAASAPVAYYTALMRRASAVSAPVPKPLELTALRPPQLEDGAELLESMKPRDTLVSPFVSSFSAAYKSGSSPGAISNIDLGQISQQASSYANDLRLFDLLRNDRATASSSCNAHSASPAELSDRSDSMASKPNTNSRSARSFQSVTNPPKENQTSALPGTTDSTTSRNTDVAGNHNSIPRPRGGNAPTADITAAAAAQAMPAGVVPLSPRFYSSQNNGGLLALLNINNRASNFNINGSSGSGGGGNSPSIGGGDMLLGVAELQALSRQLGASLSQSGGVEGRSGHRAPGTFKSVIDKDSTATRSTNASFRMCASFGLGTSHRRSRLRRDPYDAGSSTANTLDSGRGDSHTSLLHTAKNATGHDHDHGVDDSGAENGPIKGSDTAAETATPVTALAAANNFDLTNFGASLQYFNELFTPDGFAQGANYDSNLISNHTGTTTTATNTGTGHTHTTTTTANTTAATNTIEASVLTFSSSRSGDSRRHAHGSSGKRARSRSASKSSASSFGRDSGAAGAAAGYSLPVAVAAAATASHVPIVAAPAALSEAKAPAAAAHGSSGGGPDGAGRGVAAPCGSAADANALGNKSINRLTNAEVFGEVISLENSISDLMSSQHSVANSVSSQRAMNRQQSARREGYFNGFTRYGEQQQQQQQGANGNSPQIPPILARPAGRADTSGETVVTFAENHADNANNVSLIRSSYRSAAFQPQQFVTPGAGGHSQASLFESQGLLSSRQSEEVRRNTIVSVADLLSRHEADSVAASSMSDVEGVHTPSVAAVVVAGQPANAGGGNGGGGGGDNPLIPTPTAATRRDRRKSSKAAKARTSSTSSRDRRRSFPSSKAVSDDGSSSNSGATGCPQPIMLAKPGTATAADSPESPHRDSHSMVTTSSTSSSFFPTTVVRLAPPPWGASRDASTSFTPLALRRDDVDGVDGDAREVCNLQSPDSHAAGPNRSSPQLALPLSPRSQSPKHLNIAVAAAAAAAAVASSSPPPASQPAAALAQHPPPAEGTTRPVAYIREGYFAQQAPASPDATTTAAATAPATPVAWDPVPHHRGSHHAPPSCTDPAQTPVSAATPTAPKPSAAEPRSARVGEVTIPNRPPMAPTTVTAPPAFKGASSVGADAAMSSAAADDTEHGQSTVVSKDGARRNTSPSRVQQTQ